MLSIPNFKIRASAISDIMADAKKTGELSAGAKTYCEKWLMEQIYGDRPELASKEIRKGNDMEAAAMERYSNAKFGVEFYTKNDDKYENDWVTGTPDLLYKDYVADIKCSYSSATFPILETECPNKAYWWQLQGYMWLTGVRRAELVYCLENTPPAWDGGEWVLYDHVPNHLRMKVFHIDYDPAIEERIMEKVLLCRKYIAELIALLPRETE